MSILHLHHSSRVVPSNDQDSDTAENSVSQPKRVGSHRFPSSNAIEKLESSTPSVDFQNSRPSFDTVGIKFDFFRRLKRHLISSKLASMSAHEFCENFIKTNTARDECSFVDYMKLRYSHCPHPELGLTYAEAFVDTANLYVSYTWSTSVIEVIDCLDAFVEDTAGDITYAFWMDLFIINQHAAMVGARTWFPEALKAAITTIGSTLLVLSNWNVPGKHTCLQRTWCLFEVYLTSVVSGHVHVALAPKDATQFNTMIMEQVEMFMGILALISLDKSCCLEPEDHRMLLEYVTGSGETVEQASTAVARTVKQWFVGYGLQVFAQQTQTDDYELHFYSGDKMKLLSTMTSFAYLLGELQQYREAENMYRRALGCYSSQLGSDHVYALGITHNLSYLFLNEGKLQEAEEMAIAAAEGYLRTSGNTHQNTLVAHLHAADILFRRGDNARAEVYYRLGLVMCEASMGPRHPKTLEVLNKLGVIMAQQGKLNESVKLHSSALEGFATVYGEKSMSTGQTAMLLGAVYEKKQMWSKAAEMYDRAHSGLNASVGSHHPLTETALKQLEATSINADYSNRFRLSRLCLIS